MITPILTKENIRSISRPADAWGEIKQFCIFVTVLCLVFVNGFKHTLKVVFFHFFLHSN